MKPQIVILSHRQDEHALAVLSSLPPHITPFLLDISRTGIDFIVSHFGKSSLKIRSRGGDEVCFSEVKFWWNRRPRIAASPEADARFQAVQEIELEQFWTGLLGLELPGFWCNSFDAQQKIQNKIRQLHLARELGFDVPDSLWTNDPAEVAQFVEKHQGQVVFKMFSGTEAVWQPCRLFDQKFQENIEFVRFFPSIFQQYIGGLAEIRVTMFDGNCFVAKANVGHSRFPSDVRIDLNTERVQAHIEQPLRDKLKAFMSKAELNYAAFDLRQDEDGKFIFLEVNPMGQFLYLDKVFAGKILQKFSNFMLKQVGSVDPHQGSFSPSYIPKIFERKINEPIYEAADSWQSHIPRG